MSVRAFRPEACWRRVDDALAQEIVALWQREGISLAGDEPLRRAHEAVCVARDAQGAVVSVVTAQARLIPFLGETLYYLRLFVAPRARNAWLPKRQLAAAQRILAADADSEAPASDAIGIFIELENPGFARIRPRAVWPHSGFFYAGRTPRGLERRIWYFPGAQLRNSRQPLASRTG